MVQVGKHRIDIMGWKEIIKMYAYMFASFFAILLLAPWLGLFFKAYFHWVLG